jgi:hypothetical protein
MAKAIKLTDDNDLDFSTGSLVIIEDKEEIAQRIKVSLQTWLGEWFLDNSAGVDWITLMEKGTNIVKVKTEIQMNILQFEEVTGIRDFNVTFENSTRRFTIDGKIFTIFGNGLINLNEEVGI